jgi:hypothetical protein
MRDWKVDPLDTLGWTLARPQERTKKIGGIAIPVRHLATDTFAVSSHSLLSLLDSHSKDGAARRSRRFEARTSHATTSLPFAAIEYRRPGQGPGGKTEYAPVCTTSRLASHHERPLLLAREQDRRPCRNLQRSSWLSRQLVEPRRNAAEVLHRAGRRRLLVWRISVSHLGR